MGAWTDLVKATQLTAVDENEQVFDKTIPLEPGETGYVNVIINFGVGTENLIIAVYSSHDDASWTDLARLEFTVDVLQTDR